MKKDFGQLIKEIRVSHRAEFQAVAHDSTLDLDQLDKAFALLEDKQSVMVEAAGYTQDEFLVLIREHFMDFSSSNPEEWVIRHDPDNAHIIIESGKTGI
jgi:hypothetical protein